jgi:hypothetical protein
MSSPEDLKPIIVLNCPDCGSPLYWTVQRFMGEDRPCWKCLRNHIWLTQEMSDNFGTHLCYGYCCGPDCTPYLDGIKYGFDNEPSLEDWKKYKAEQLEKWDKQWEVAHKNRQK